MSDEYVTIDEVARKLHISLPTVRSWVKAGHIGTQAYIRVGTTYRFNMDAVLRSLHGAMSEEEADNLEPNPKNPTEEPEDNTPENNLDEDY